jgi:hypothetical protein
MWSETSSGKIRFTSAIETHSSTTPTSLRGVLTREISRQSSGLDDE